MINVGIDGQRREFKDAEALACFMCQGRSYTAAHRESVKLADNLCHNAGGQLVSRQAIAAILVAVDMVEVMRSRSSGLVL